MASECGRSPDEIHIPDRGSALLAAEVAYVEWSPDKKPVKIGTKKSLKGKHASLRGSESRHVRTRGAAIYTGMHPVSLLDGKMLAGEASIEQDFWMIADMAFEDLVEAYAQPFTTIIELRGVTMNWTPDALLERQGRPDTLIECKPLIALQPDPKEFPQEAALARERYDAWLTAATRLGMDLIVMSEDDVRLEPRFHNAGIMHRAAGSPLPSEWIGPIVSVLCGWGTSCSVRDVSGLLGEYAGSGLLVACNLDRLGYVRLDRTTYFTPETTMINKMAGINSRSHASE